MTNEQCRALIMMRLNTTPMRAFLFFWYGSAEIRVQHLKERADEIMKVAGVEKDAPDTAGEALDERSN